MYVPLVTLKPRSQPRLLPLCSIWANRMFPAEGYDPSALEAVQLEDGSTAYIHHPVAVPSDSTILAVQTEVGLEDLATEDDEGFSADTVVALEQYASKVSSFGPAKPATFLEDKGSPVPGHGRDYSLCPSTLAPPTYLSHVIVSDKHRSLARAADSCVHSRLFMLSVQREGSCRKQRYPYGGNLGPASLWLYCLRKLLPCQ